MTKQMLLLIIGTQKYTEHFNFWNEKKTTK